MNETKHFLGEAVMFRGGSGRGMNEYELTKDTTGKLVFILRGSFTLSELKRFTDALATNNEQFEMPGAF